MIIIPKVRGFICVTAHPEGCAAHVQAQIRYIQSLGRLQNGPKNALIIGASTGYGLASRVATAFGAGTSTVGVFYESPPEGGKTASAGFYNTAAFTRAARERGLYAKNLNGDAFSEEMKHRAVALIKNDLGTVDLVIYSLASPRRTNPRTGTTHKSCLKPVGAAYSSRTLDTGKKIVTDITIEPASQTEIADTVAVMGGEDWLWWIEALESGGVLAPGTRTLAYSYIGPEITFPIYRNGTIGRAKEHLEQTAHQINARLEPLGGGAFVSVNKALVTQASSAIPVVPLYISILYKVMKVKGLHEGCIEQMARLFYDRLYTGGATPVDGERRIRLDDWEMRDDVQAAVADIWPRISTENLDNVSDFAGYQKEFLRLFGFGLEDVDYEIESDPLKISGREAVI